MGKLRPSYIVDIVLWVIFIMTHFLERVKEQTPMT